MNLTTKHLLIRLFSAAALCMAGCIVLPTPFERIKDDKPRLIDFMYEPAEAAPGDTVTLRALFAGRKISLADANWRFSSSVLKNFAGTDSAYNTYPLEATIDTCYFSENTTCLRVRFVIPDNCIRESPMVMENLSALASSLPDNLLPEGFTAGTLDETIAMIDFLARLDTPTLQAIAKADSMKDVVAQLPLFSQLLTVPVRIFADIIGDHTIQSDYAVSYAPRFARLSGSRLFPNHNPVIDSVVVFKVKGTSVLTYDPYGADVERFRLKDARDDDSVPVIPIDVGYSYFIEAATHGRDSVITLGDLSAVKLEDFNAEWMFHLDSTETAGYNTNQLLFISSLGDLDGALTPPQKGSVVHFTIWAQVTDSKLGVLNRSQGSAVAEVSGTFSYTDAYLKQFK